MVDFRMIRSRSVTLMALGAFLLVLSADKGNASGKQGVITDPAVLSPQRFSSDVSAFYLGISGSRGTGGSDRFGLSDGSNEFTIGELEPSGTIGGIRGGWRGVLPAVGGRDYVYGVELGYDFGSLEDTVSTQVGTATLRAGSEISDIFSFRLRNGLTNKSGRILYFVTLGYVRGEVTTTNSLASGPSVLDFEDSGNRNGFSVSLGAEHKLSDNWSITGEYEYVQFDSRDVEFDSGFSTKSTPNYRGLRFGLNYEF